MGIVLKEIAEFMNIEVTQDEQVQRDSKISSMAKRSTENEVAKQSKGH